MFVCLHVHMHTSKSIHHTGVIFLHKIKSICVSLLLKDGSNPDQDPRTFSEIFGNICLKLMAQNLCIASGSSFSHRLVYTPDLYLSKDDPELHWDFKGIFGQYLFQLPGRVFVLSQVLLVVIKMPFRRILKMKMLFGFNYFSSHAIFKHTN